MSPAVSRTLTIIAAGVLAFDGAALAALGLWTDRIVLVPVGAVFFLSSGLVWLYWRWYRRRLDDIRADRRAMGDEVRALLEIVRGKEKREP